MKRTSTKRPGYAMLLVLGFVLLMSFTLALAYGQLATLLRTQTARARQVQRDQGSTVAAAAGLALLETGLPPTNPYVCGATIDMPSGPASFTVTFASSAGGTWTVTSEPTPQGNNPSPMPATFATSGS
jgi:hypothetical protein